MVRTPPLREQVQPGDVLVVHDHNVWAWLIRLGPRLHNLTHRDVQDTRWNHVLVAMPPDATGTRWAISAQPHGGVGWTDLDAAGYLDDPHTLTNAAQPRSDAQRATVCATMEALATRHVPYDWDAIAMEIVREVAPMWAWRDVWGPGAPTALICSSAADLAYARTGLPNPPYDEFCAPWDWASWIERKGWAT